MLYTNGDTMFTEEPKVFYLDNPCIVILGRKALHTTFCSTRPVDENQHVRDQSKDRGKAFRRRDDSGWPTGFLPRGTALV